MNKQQRRRARQEQRREKQLKQCRKTLFAWRKEILNSPDRDKELVTHIDGLLAAIAERLGEDVPKGSFILE